jgi:hypothetical protein
VFYRLPLPLEPTGSQPPSGGGNRVRLGGVDCATAEQMIDALKKEDLTDPSIAVLRTTDNRVFHRDELAVIVQRNLPDRLER